MDKKALLAKYIEERDKRLRNDGSAQYQRLEGKFEHYAVDPHTPRVEREAITDHVTFAFVGGGFAGLLAGARLKERGIEDVRIIEKGGDFGGAWYWNRYPGAQCDTASMVYMPMLEETGHMPTEKYAHGPEILGQCQRIGRQYDLYGKALFHTIVTGAEWDDENDRWTITTDRGDRFTASFIGLGTGPLHVPKLPGIPGIEDFEGHSFHTSRWDYGYTGGDPEGAPLDRLADKRVAIIGTGATSVQVVPHLARIAGRLYVVQRTPSSIDARNNEPIDPDWFEEIAEEGWQQKWLENFTDNSFGGAAEEDLVQDGWTDISRRIRARLAEIPRGQIDQGSILAAYEDCDFEKMEEIRARTQSIVQDKETAEKLKAWYRQMCKRPCFHDDYLPAFNVDTVELVHTDGKGVERITAKGFVVDGKEHEVDCIIYASGFVVSLDNKVRAGFDLTGRGGLKLSEAWGGGMRTLHGVHSHGFPNCFFVQPTQGANLISNVPHNLTEIGHTIAAVVSTALDRGIDVVEVTKTAQDDWIDLLLSGSARMARSPDCTPGYYNNEGQDAGPAAAFAVGYPQGPSAYFRYLKQWRARGDFEGLAFDGETLEAPAQALSA